MIILNCHLSALPGVSAPLLRLSDQLNSISALTYHIFAILSYLILFFSVLTSHIHYISLQFVSIRPNRPRLCTLPGSAALIRFPAIRVISRSFDHRLVTSQVYSITYQVWSAPFRFPAILRNASPLRFHAFRCFAVPSLFKTSLFSSAAYQVRSFPFHRLATLIRFCAIQRLAIPSQI